MLEYKSVPFEVKALDAAEDGGWEIAGLASTWWGEPDSYGDVVAPGAFAESIAERTTKFFYEHREPIGRQLELREDERGLYGRWSIVPTTAGTDAYKLAKAGVLDSLSIGYLAEDVEFRDDGVRILKRVTLLEVSAVALPANQSAVVTDVKREQRAVWSAAYINDLSDSAFALILPGGEKDADGKTTPRSLRKLPHHDAGGKLDEPHLNNALSRAPQMTGVSDAQRDRAIAHLRRHKEKSEAAAEHEPELPLIADAFAIDLEPIRRRLTAIGILE
jgi:HK97 family phage prohead protease